MKISHVVFSLLSVYAALGPLKEDVSRIGADDDDRQAKGLFIALPDWRFIVALRFGSAMNGTRARPKRLAKRASLRQGSGPARASERWQSRGIVREPVATSRYFSAAPSRRRRINLPPRRRGLAPENVRTILLFVCTRGGQ